MCSYTDVVNTQVTTGTIKVQLTIKNLPFIWYIYTDRTRKRNVWGCQISSCFKLGSKRWKDRDPKNSVERWACHFSLQESPEKSHLSLKASWCTPSYTKNTAATFGHIMFHRCHLKTTQRKAEVLRLPGFHTNERHVNQAHLLENKHYKCT